MKAHFLLLKGQLDNATALFPDIHNIFSLLPFSPCDFWYPCPFLNPLAPRKWVQSCSCSGAVPTQIRQRAADKQCRECTTPRSGHCFRLSPMPATAFHKAHRNLIISETYNPFQIWLRLASSWETLLHADRQRDRTNFISLGNQANRTNSEK